MANNTEENQQGGGDKSKQMKSTSNLLETSVSGMSATSPALFLKVLLIESVRHMWNFRTSPSAMPFAKIRKKCCFMMYV